MRTVQDDVLVFREELLSAENPLFLYDDDPDGLTSFLLLYRKVKKGKGTFVKSVPKVGIEHLKHVEEYNPDKIFILDMPMVDQEFIDKAIAGGKRKIIWVDHHESQKNTGVFYLNPRNYDDKDNRPTNYWCYQAVQQDQWISLAGCLADWFVPEFAAEFSKQYPKILPPEVTTIEEALFTTLAGRLSRIFSFILKGKSSDSVKCIKILTRIEHFNELLEQTTAQGNFVYKRYEAINQEYEELLASVSEKDLHGNLVLFMYHEKKTSFTSDLSNELIFKFPGKVILICREKGGEMKCSMRGATYDLPTIIHKSLEGLKGYGGGHMHACGVCVAVKDWDMFLERVKKEIKN